LITYRVVDDLVAARASSRARDADRWCEAQANEQRYGEQKCEDYKIFGRAYST